MKLSESLLAVGKSFPYYPKLCPIVGGTNACIFLCAIFWKAYEDKEGWVQITMEQLTELTGMSKDEQRIARRNLKQLGILEERSERLLHRMFYRINSDALDAAFEGQSEAKNGTHNCQSPEGGKPDFGKVENPTSKKIDQYPDQYPLIVPKKEACRTPAMLRLDKLFGRRSTTRWDKKEIAALKAAEPIPEEDFQTLERYYLSNHPPTTDYRRRDLKTLLNNWNGEMDRARQFKPNTGY